MKFANVHSAPNSGRFALRLALFSFLCLIVFAMSSPRFGVAPAAGAATKAATQTQKRAGGKAGGLRVAGGAQTSAKSVSKAAAKGTGGDDVQPNVFCPQTQPIGAGQTSGTLTANDCKLSDQTAFDEYIFNGTAGQQISITLNSNDFDTYLFLVKPGETSLTQQTIQDDDGGTGGRGRQNNPNTNSRIPAGSGVITLPTTGQYSILANAFDAGSEGLGSYTLTVTLGATCSSTAINFNETRTGTLATGDCANPVEADNTLADLYTFSGTAGQQISITMTGTSGNIDPYLYLVLPNGEVHADDNNGGGGTTARLPQFDGTFGRLPMTGNYTIVANTALVNQSGNYTITLNVAAAPCPSTPIAVGGTANGALATGDCRLLEDSSFIDAYTFSGTAGQSVVISMTSTSNTLSPALFLLSPEGIPLAIEVAPTGNSTVRIPEGAGSFTLPATGTYTILANSFEPGQTGNYTLRIVNPSACSTTLTTPGREISGGGGQFAFNFTTQPGCTVSAVSNSGFILVNTAGIDGNGAGTVTYTVQPNTGAAARTGTITVNGQTFTVTQGAACSYAIYPTVRPFRQDGGTNGRFTVITQSGCPWTATSNAPWITITEGTSNSGTGRVRYTVAANNTTATRSGTITVTGGLTHTVWQTSAGTTPQVQFSGNAEFTVNENDPSRAAVINVTRTGDTTGAVTVDYATLDDTAEVPCDPNIKRTDGSLFPQGTAYARCDYATTIDTLTFNPGETTRTIRIPLINDVFQENNERFALSLFNPQGATLGNAASATITLVSDDTAPPTTNPINQISFFVRQHYLDFLDREPEPAEPWSGVLTRCGNIFTGPEVNTDCDRIAVSGAFFGSPEYRIKGLSVFLHYKAAFGSANNPFYVPQYDEFVRDTRRVSGLTAEEVIAKRLDFTEDFLTGRADVANIFSGTSNAEFVDRILGNLGITMTTADPASGETRNSLVNGLNAGTRTRAQVLRLIVDSTEAIAAQFNRAFVAIQYYGYLRRTPEPQGYLNNLNALNATNNSRLLINGFLNSIEYRIRFGANTTNP